MLTRWLSLVVLGLALSACSNGGIAGSTRQYSGVLLYEFEGATFVEDATAIPLDRPPYKESDWLEWTDWPALEGLMRENRPQTIALASQCQPIQPFLVTFVGRRTHHPLGGAGHMGLWRSEIMVQKPISAKALGPPFCYER